MSQLVIQLTGQIKSSNFAEWKQNLIANIQSTNITLETDADYVAAIEHVKLFKDAEASLREAKQTAIDQAPDIHVLFAAIDEISNKAKQVRLLLERQIKARKKEIKEQIIQAGINEVQKFIATQSPDFQIIDHSAYLNRSRFELAAKGKTTTKSVQTEIKNLCDAIKEDIGQKAHNIKSNRAALNAVPRPYKMLFQDLASLFALNEQEIKLTIQNRIALLNEENARIKADDAIQALKKIEDSELNADTNPPRDSSVLKLQKYKIVIDLLATKDTAIDVARTIKQTYGNTPSVLNIKLSRAED